jgi:hypothetical protein
LFFKNDFTDRSNCSNRSGTVAGAAATARSANTVQFEGKLAEQQQPLLLELQQINAKATKPDVPINQQLSKADVARFQQLREQSLTLQARSRLSSRHERAANIV